MPRNRSEKDLGLSLDGLEALETIRASSASTQEAVNAYLRDRFNNDEDVWVKHWNRIGYRVRCTLVELPLSERRRLYGILSS